MSHFRRRTGLLCLTLGAMGLVGPSAVLAGVLPEPASDRLRAVVSSGDPIPGTSDTFSFISDVALNNVGQVAYVASGNFEIGSGLYRTELDQSPVTIAVGGQTLTNGLNLSGFFGSAGTRPTLLNDLGQVAFSSSFENQDFTEFGYGVFLGDGGPLGTVAVDGDVAGGLELNLMDVGFSRMRLNNSGQVAFRGNQVFGEFVLLREVVLRGAVGQPSVVIAEAGQALSSGQPLSDFPNFSGLGLSGGGDVSFLANRAFDPENSDPNTGVILRGSGGGLNVLVESGTPTPPGIGTIRVPDGTISPLTANESGGLVFLAEIQLVNNGGGFQRGIFTIDGNGTLREVVRDGTVAEGGGQFTGFNFNVFQSDLAFNNSGQVAFTAEVVELGQVPNGIGGLYIGDGVNPIQKIVGAGETIPGGDGVFGSIERVAINDVGQAVFTSFINGLNSGPGIFFYDPQLGLIEAVRNGQGFLGSTIDLFSSTLELNDRGQFIFDYNLLEGGSGVAIWTMPILGDFNADALIDLADLELLVANYGSADAEFDVAGDGGVAGLSDLTVLVEDLIGTFMGDADLDGTVGLVDLSLLAGNFGAFGPSIGWSQGDFDGSGQVTLADLSLLATNFGQTAAVPSPATGVMVGMGLLVLRRR
ncbi:MAG: hypothetical protein RIG82_00755 [Phycisphaeraceae bacterium]